MNKPKCKLIGANGNAFNLIGIASKALKQANQKDKATEMSQKCFSANSYNEVLTIIGEYVEIE